MPDTFSINLACLQTSPFETVIIIQLKEKLCILQYTSIYSFITLIGLDHCCMFFKTTYFILVNFQVVAGGKTCCFRQLVLPVTTW